MKFLIEPSEGAWVAVNDKYAGNDSQDKIKERLRDNILEREMWFSDIETLAKIPSWNIALQHVGTSFSEPDYLKWVSSIILALTLKDKDAEADCWHRCSSKFLKRTENDEELKRFLSQQKIGETLYPGTTDFFSQLDAWKYFITRNVERVGKEYRKVLDFTRFFHETNDKEDRANKLFFVHPHRNKYAVSGNSNEDLVVVDTLNRFGCGVLSLYVADSPKKANEQFDVSIGKDYSGLVKILDGN
jgi:hypothetical protein